MQLSTRLRKTIPIKIHPIQQMVGSIHIQFNDYILILPKLGRHVKWPMENPDNIQESRIMMK
jgi:hypothetical protein